MTTGAEQRESTEDGRKTKKRIVLRSLDSVNTEWSPESYWLGPNIEVGVGGGWGVGGGGTRGVNIYSPHCHHQNDSVLICHR